MTVACIVSVQRNLPPYPVHAFLFSASSQECGGRCMRLDEMWPGAGDGFEEEAEEFEEEGGEDAGGHEENMEQEEYEEEGEEHGGDATYEEEGVCCHAHI
jgi:hypothetical protein